MAENDGQLPETIDAAVVAEVVHEVFEKYGDPEGDGETVTSVSAVAFEPFQVTITMLRPRPDRKSPWSGPVPLTTSVRAEITDENRSLIVTWIERLGLKPSDVLGLTIFPAYVNATVIKRGKPGEGTSPKHDGTYPKVIIDIPIVSKENTRG